MSERLMMEGSLQRKKMHSMELATRAAGLIRSLKIIIQPAAITPLADLRTGEALALMQDLHEVRIEYFQVISEMEEIRKELKG